MKINKKTRKLKNKAQGSQWMFIVGAVIAVSIIFIVVGLQRGWFGSVYEEGTMLIEKTGDVDNDNVFNFQDKCGIPDCNPSLDKWANKPVETDNPSRMGCTEDQKPLPNQWKVEGKLLGGYQRAERSAKLAEKECPRLSAEEMDSLLMITE